MKNKINIKRKKLWIGILFSCLIGAILAACVSLVGLK